MLSVCLVDPWVTTLRGKRNPFLSLHAAWSTYTALSLTTLELDELVLSALPTPCSIPFPNLNTWKHFCPSLFPPSPPLLGKRTRGSTVIHSISYPLPSLAIGWAPPLPPLSFLLPYQPPGWVGGGEEGGIILLCRW